MNHTALCRFTKFSNYFSASFMGNNKRNNKRNRSGNPIEITEVSDKDYRTLQQIADKATADLKAARRVSSNPNEWETKDRPSHGKYPCGAFNYFGCNKKGKCERQHCDSHEAMARYREFHIARKWDMPTKTKAR